MLEKDLIDLGFYKEDGEDFYYYCLDLGDSFNKLTLISNSNDEVDNIDYNSWYVEIFENGHFRWRSRMELKQFIEMLRNAMNVKNEDNE